MTNQNETQSITITKHEGAVKMNKTNLITMKYYEQERVNGRWTTTNTPYISTITLDQFISAFVIERWTNERRYNKQYSKLGYYHTKTIVNFDENNRSVREFTFPN